MKNNFPKDTTTYKLIVSDFDGTLAGADHTVNQKVREAVMKWNSKGKYFTIATGRQYLMIEEDCRTMGLKIPVIVRGGAEVVDPVSGNVIHAEYMSASDVEKLIKIFSDNNMSFLIEKDNTLYSNFKYFLDFPKIVYKNTTDFKIQGAPKIVVSADARKSKIVQKFMEEVENRFSNINIVRTHGKLGYGWDVTSVKATKLHGIVKVMEILGIKREHIVGVGDSYNDFPLLEAAGLKVAMANGHQELKEIADIIVPSHDEDGVAYLIEKLLSN